jgi:hypothetical protein
MENTMNIYRIGSWCIVAALLTLGGPLGLNKANALQRDAAGADEGIEILTRGPVHEAFAETVTFDPEPGLIAPKLPPEAIEEVPPEQRLEGDNVDWIPGYWAWDDERTDFLWISGTWRALPPGRQWVPGYWSPSGQGSQWTSGYWADANVNEIEYLPEPPATVEVGPNVAAPSVDHTWMPGCWVWQQDNYAWRPGYWEKAQQNWVWIPAHYHWSPRGYVFIDGYYDHSVARRGVVYAPVYFNSSIYNQRGYNYSPVTVINPAVFASHLFLRPNYGHYYYGDYYASNYTDAGYSPWFSFNSSRYGYDPFYAQQRWLNRQDQRWEQSVQADFQNRRNNENARPPRTWSDQVARIAKTGSPNRENLVVAKSIEELVKSTEIPVRFQPLDKTQRQQFSKYQQAVRQQRDLRQKAEVQVVDPSAAQTKSERQTSRAKVKLPNSPIVAPPIDRMGKDFAPPKRHEAPQADPKIAPTVRKPREIKKSAPEVPKVLPPQGDPRGNAKGSPKSGELKGGNSKGGDSKGGDSKGKSKEKPKGKDKS